MPAYSNAPAPVRSRAHTHGRAPLVVGRRGLAVTFGYSFKAAINSFLSSFACFIIEINVPFASSG
ncbi:MAG: hypothetical protein NTX42_08935 [Methanothrix sp.]|nr:hypothetical protein [Methanothrix sp.]